MPKNEKKSQKRVFEYEKKEHILLKEVNTETAKKQKGGRFIPKTIETKDLPEHSEMLSEEFEQSIKVSKSRRKIFQTKNVYFKITFMNDIYYHEKDLEKNGMDLLIVLDSNKAIVKLADEETAEFSDKIKYYEEKQFKTLLRRVSSIDPIKTNEKIESSLESEIKEKEEDKQLFVEIRLFPNLDQDEYNGALKSIKEYLKTKEEELVSEIIEEKRAKIRARVHLSSIRELTEGVEPISMVDKVPRFHIGFSQPRQIRSDLNDFHPQIKEDSPTICIIDSGVVREHPLLQGVIDEVVDFTEMGENGYDNDGHQYLRKYNIF